MAQEDRLSRGANIAKIAGSIISLAILFLGGGFVYNELWHVSDLRYTVLPTYDVEKVAFSGLVLENRGQAPARGVDIILDNLEHNIQNLYMPPPHEKAIDDFDPNNPTNAATIEMERLSPGSSLSIYLLTSGPVTLAEGKTFVISSERGRAISSSNGTDWRLLLVGGLINTLAWVFSMAAALWLYLRVREARERRYL